jgi:hypothetical protein
MLGAQERAFEVDVHRELPLLDRTLLQGLTCGGAHNVAGVVDQDVDLAEFSEDRVDGGCHLLLEADVANEPCGPSTGIRGNPARCALRVGQDAAGDGDIGAGFGERGRHVKTQVAGPPVTRAILPARSKSSGTVGWAIDASDQGRNREGRLTSVPLSDILS